jgi:hypothetical protein
LHLVKCAKTVQNGPGGSKKKSVHPVYPVHLVYKMPVPEISSKKSSFCHKPSMNLFFVCTSFCHIPINRCLIAGSVT